jgi:8-oxo-dGTP pyrophosphatase MutT (NUDIX family)
MKNTYVAGFMFSPDFENVILIEKEKPAWQKGKYNAVGGKIENAETPMVAMAREFKKETFIETKPEDWRPLCRIGMELISFSFFTQQIKTGAII